LRIGGEYKVVGWGKNSHRLTTFTLVGLVNANANAVLLKPLQIIGSLRS
jgi:hypothetical protein